jgi:aminopeptidase N
MKAIWRVSVTHPADMIALANGAEIQFNSTGEWITTKFTPTPPMSSYLLAIAVGHFSSLEMISDHGILTRIWTWTGNLEYVNVLIIN